MLIGIPHYCENGDCDVLLYQVTVDDWTAGRKNCPGCGQFGHTKGRPSLPAPAPAVKVAAVGGRPVTDTPQA